MSNAEGLGYGVSTEDDTETREIAIWDLGNGPVGTHGVMRYHYARGCIVLFVRLSIYCTVSVGKLGNTCL